MDTVHTAQSADANRWSCGPGGRLPTSAPSQLADEGTVYDPRDPNDRLLLGVKGTLSEAELFTLRTRLHEGRWNKARKGLLQFPLPVGFVRAPDGAWDLDPDRQVHERLAYLFKAFRRLGVARQVVRELKQHSLDLPTRIVSKGIYGTLVWKRPTLSAVVRILENPAFAGIPNEKSRWPARNCENRTGTAMSERRSTLNVWPIFWPKSRRMRPCCSSASETLKIRWCCITWSRTVSLHQRCLGQSQRVCCKRARRLPRRLLALLPLI